jgi:hypothetical protein
MCKYEIKSHLENPMEVNSVYPGGRLGSSLDSANDSLLRAGVDMGSFPYGATLRETSATLEKEIADLRERLLCRTLRKERDRLRGELALKAY